jgi:hypothetical protein
MERPTIMDNSERPRLKFVLAMIPLLALAPMRACATSKLAVNNPGAAAASEATDGPVVCGTCGDVGPEDGTTSTPVRPHNESAAAC